MRKRVFRQGKTFYSLLALLLIFTYVPILIAMILAQRMLVQSHEQLQTLLVAAQDTQLQYIQEVSQGRNHTEQVAQLQENTFLEAMGIADDLEYGPEVEQAEQALADVTPESDNGVVSTYLYFPNSDYLIDYHSPGGNAVDSVDPIAFLGLDDSVYNTAGVARVYFYRNPDDSEDVHSIYTATIFPGVIFIFDMYMPEYLNTGRQDIFMMIKLADSLQDAELCYYDSYGNYRVSLGSEELCSQYTFDTLGPDEDSYFSFKANGHSYLCCYTYNEDNISKFALFCRDETAEGLVRTTTLLWVSVGLFLLLILVVAIFYVRRTYRPIRGLMNRLHVDEAEKPPLQRDEFAAMNQAIDSFDRQLEQRDRILEKYYLLRLLQGKNPEVLDTYTDKWLTEEDQHRFGVAVLHVDEAEDGMLVQESVLEQQILSFMDEQHLDVRVVSDEDFFELVFRLDLQTTAEQVLEACVNLQASLPQYCFSIFVSSLFPSMRELRRGYSQAMVAAEYYISNEKVNIIVSADSVPASYDRNKTSAPDYNLVKKLSDCIAAADTEEALRTFDQLADQLRQSEPLSAGTEDPALSLIKNSISLAFYDSGLVDKASLPSYVDNIRSTETLEQLRSILVKSLQKLSRHLDSPETYDPRLDSIKEYILAHYSDPNLDAAMIADAYKISPSTVTRLFKKYNGTGFLEFVHQVRVEKAIALLKTTDLPIAEISGMVGYTNAATMNRAFKARAYSTHSMIRRSRDNNV